MRFPDSTPDALDQRKGSWDGRLLDLFSCHREEGDQCRGSHINRQRPGKGLRPVIADRVEDGAVPLIVRNRHRGRPDAPNRRRHHLQLGEGAAHAVRIHHWQTFAGGDGERDHGVHASRLHWHGCHNLFAEIFAERPDGGNDLIAGRDLLNHHGGCAHHRGRNDKRIVVELLHIEEGHRRTILHR